MTQTPQASMRELFKNGVAALRSGNLPGAVSFADQMITRDQHDHNGWLLRAQARFPLGMPEAAMADLQAALRLRPTDPGVLIAVGNGCQALNNHPAAIAAFDDALAQQPGALDAIVGKARSLDHLGRPGDAARLVEPLATGAQPALPAVGQYLQLLTRDGRPADAIELGQRAIRSGVPDTRSTAGIYYALARACEDVGEYDDAMQHAAKANAIVAAGFDQGATKAAIDELLTVFSEQRMRMLPRVDDIDTSLPIFVLGMPRSGSTLVERIIDAHPKAYGAGEQPMLHMIAHQIGRELGTNLPYPQSVCDLTAEIARAASTSYLQGLRERGGESLRIVDKYLTNFKYLGLIHCLFPQAHVIHTQRDPLDVCLSCYFEPLASAHIPWSTSMDNIAFMCAQHERIMNHFSSVTDVPLLQLCYERLVEAPESKSREMISFCGLEWDDACMEYYKTERSARTLSHAQVRKPIYDSSIGRAARFGAAIEPLRDAVERHMRDVQSVPVTD